MGLRHTRNIKGLVEIDVALGRRRVGILFGQTQHLVEFLAQDVGLIFVVFERLLEGVFAAAGFAAHVLHRDVEIGKRRALLVLLKSDDSLGDGVDVQIGFAARTFDGNQLGCLCHASLSYTDFPGGCTNMFDDFKKFVMRGNVMDLAVGVIIGGAFGKIVDSLVGDLIMPVVGLVLGKVDFANLFVSLNGTTYATLADAKKAAAPVLAYGSFINVVVNFLILAFVIFILVKQVNKMMPEAPPRRLLHRLPR